MYGVSKAFSLAIISLSAAVIMVVIFAWQGPGLDNVTPSASAALFDEQLVQGIYDQAIPAVVDINIDRKVEDSFGRLGFGSGFLSVVTVTGFTTTGVSLIFFNSFNTSFTMGLLNVSTRHIFLRMFLGLPQGFLP